MNAFVCSTLLYCLEPVANHHLTDTVAHGLRTPSEGINLKKSENLGRCGWQNMLWPYLRIWDWDWIFGRAVKAFFSPGVRSPCSFTLDWIFHFCPLFLVVSLKFR